MVRNQVRKTTCTPAALVMEVAVHAVVSREKSLSVAALTDIVSVSSTGLPDPKDNALPVCCEVKNIHWAHISVFSPMLWCPSHFTDEEESLLSEYLLRAAKLHHGLSPKATRELAFEFAEANQKEIPDSWVLNQTAGEDWFLADVNLRSRSLYAIARPRSSVCRLSVCL